MKHFLILGMVFLPTVSHLILYIFKRDILYSKMLVVGILCMLNILTAYTSFSSDSIRMEIHVSLLMLLSAGLYLLYFEVEDDPLNKLPGKFEVKAFKIYTISSIVMLIGATAMVEVIRLPVSGSLYFILGFFGIQFVFFWKLKLLESSSELLPVSKSFIKDTQEIIFDKEEHKLLSLLLEGKTDKEISELVFRSQPTIKKQLSNLYKKMEVKNRTEAALYYKKIIRNDF